MIRWREGLLDGRTAERAIETRLRHREQRHK